MPRARRLASGLRRVGSRLASARALASARRTASLTASARLASGKLSSVRPLTSARRAASLTASARLASAKAASAGLASRRLASARLASGTRVASGVRGGRFVASLRLTSVSSRIASGETQTGLASLAPDVVKMVRVQASNIDADKVASAVARRLASARDKLSASPIDVNEVVASRMVGRLLSERISASLGRIRNLDRLMASAIGRRKASDIPKTETSAKSATGKAAKK